MDAADPTPSTPTADASSPPQRSTPDPVTRLLTWARNEAQFAFQPIVDPYTGSLYGVEALMRGHDELDFTSVHGFFDFCHRLDILQQIEVLLRGRAMKLFAAQQLGASVRLFLNIDNRVLKDDDHRTEDTVEAAHAAGLQPSLISLEISERHQLERDVSGTETLAQTYRRKSFRIAIDDFGTGFAGLKLLYEQNPDYIKIDRFFISGIEDDRMKKLFVSQIVGLAQTIGITVIAEGVETERELLTCKEMGCNLVQGYFIEKPLITAGIKATYPGARDLRKGETDRRFIDQELSMPPPIRTSYSMMATFEHFRENKNMTFFPVVDDLDEPLGIIREEDLKDFTYSRYGKDLLANASYKRHLNEFVRACPVADIHDNAERVLEKYSLSGTKEGIIVVENLRYVGFLTASSLLQVVNEKHLAMARDANPLTKLPGNHMVVEYVTDLVHDNEAEAVIAYFDFDNFKPFNDAYGFRQGDRAILLFADLMKKALVADGAFLGHIGGDDFFAGWRDTDPDSARQRVADLRDAFRHQVETFYDKAAREAGGIVAKDRSGVERKFPLLTVSVAVMHLKAGRGGITPDSLAERIAGMKKQAKRAENGIAEGTVG
jgi:diguanylate cyclase (GGDEF)-like protein